MAAARTSDKRRVLNTIISRASGPLVGFATSMPHAPARNWRETTFVEAYLSSDAPALSRPEDDKETLQGRQILNRANNVYVSRAMENRPGLI